MENISQLTWPISTYPDQVPEADNLNYFMSYMFERSSLFAVSRKNKVFHVCYREGIACQYHNPWQAA